MYKEVLGLKAGIVFIDYEYRNDLAEYFRQKHFDMDFAMLIALDYGTISYRSVKDEVNVGSLRKQWVEGVMTSQLVVQSFKVKRMKLLKYCLYDK